MDPITKVIWTHILMGSSWRRLKSFKSFVLGSWRQVMQSYLTQVLTSCQRTDSNLDGFGLMPLFKSISSLASIELKHPITFYHRVAPFCSWSMSLSFFLMTTEAPQSTAKLPLKNTKWGQLTFFINYTYFPKFCRASKQSGGTATTIEGINSNQIQNDQKATIPACYTSWSLQALLDLGSWPFAKWVFV